jgi:hypothetical protein
MKIILASGQILFRIFHLALLLLAGSVTASPSQSADSPSQSADSSSQSADSLGESDDQPASENTTRRLETADFVCKCGVKVCHYFLNRETLSFKSDHD